MFVRPSTFKECFPLLKTLWEDLEESQIFPYDNIHTKVNCKIKSPEVNVSECSLKYCVVEHRNNLVGCSHSYLTNKNELRIRGTYVSPEFRKTGVASNMINYLINSYSDIKLVYTFPRVGTEKFYQSLGFVVSEDKWEIYRGIRYAEKLL